MKLSDFFGAFRKVNFFCFRIDSRMFFLRKRYLGVKRQDLIGGRNPNYNGNAYELALSFFVWNFIASYRKLRLLDS